jgi:hypothetical protein
MVLDPDGSVRLQGSTKTVAATSTEAGGTYGRQRTTIWDFGETGSSRLMIDTREPDPHPDNIANDSGVEYCRNGHRRWLVGLNANGVNIDSFDWYSTHDDEGSPFVGPKMSLSQKGHLGIGVTPAYPIHIAKSNSEDVVGLIINQATDGYGLVLRNGNDSNYCLAIQNAAASANPIQLFGNGTINCTHLSAVTITCDTLTETSDRSFKKNVQSIGSTLDRVRELRGVSFEWAEDKNTASGTGSSKRQLGVIGQEVEQVFPELVSTNADGVYSVNYSKLCVVLLEAVKDLDRQISQLAA